jgi:hypothetical protein
MTSNRAPQCGCDGVTYWNETVAAHNGMSIKSAGACTTGVGGAATCIGFGTCGGGAKCNLHYAQKSMCNQAPSGTCWMLPPICPLVVGPKTRACGAASGSCTDECALVTLEKAYFDDTGCPL